MKFLPTYLPFPPQVIHYTSFVVQLSFSDSPLRPSLLPSSIPGVLHRHCLGDGKQAKDHSNCKVFHRCTTSTNFFCQIRFLELNRTCDSPTVLRLYLYASRTLPNTVERSPILLVLSYAHITLSFQFVERGLLK